MMGLTGNIGHIGLRHKGEVHGTAAHIVRQAHGHDHLKGAVFASLSLAFVHYFFTQGIAEIAALPVPGVAEPPECHLTANGVLDLGILYRYTGIADGLAFCTYGVTSLIGFLIVFKFHLERRTLVFFHTDGRRAVINIYRKAAVQQPLRQRQFRGTPAEAVGRKFLLSHYLVVSIAQFYVDTLTFDSHIVQR